MDLNKQAIMTSVGGIALGCVEGFVLYSSVTLITDIGIHSLSANARITAGLAFSIGVVIVTLAATLRTYLKIQA